MQSVKNLKKEIEAGRKGKNVGISTGMPKLDSLIYGIQKRALYLIGSDSGAGKSSFVIDVFIYNLIKNRKDRAVNILLYSFEMSTSVVFAKMMSLYLFDEYEIFITYEQILSLSSPIDDETYKYVEKGLEWLETVQKHITIYDKALTPGGIYATCKEWLRKFGEFVQMGEHKEDYITKDDDMYKVVIWDHMGLIAGQESTKMKMDTVSNYAIYFRNKCNITGVFVQQLNRNAKSVERKTSGYELLNTSDLSDSSGPTQAAETILLIYYPYREKVPRVEGYPIQNTLKHRFRLVQCTKNRFGRADVNVGATFHGEIGMFRELPRPDEISDYSVYMDIETSGKPLDGQVQQIDEINLKQDDDEEIMFRF